MEGVFGIPFPEFALFWGAEAAGEETNEVGKMDGDYLALGRKLQTLARERFSKKELHFSDLASRLAKIPYEGLTLHEALKKIASVFRPMLRSTGKQVYESEFVKQLHDLMPHIEFDLFTYSEFYDFEISGREIRDLVPRNLCTRAKKLEEGEQVVYLTSPEVFGQGVVLLGFQKTKGNDKVYGIRGDRLSHLCDIPIALAYLYLYDVCTAYFGSAEYLQSIPYLSLQERAKAAFDRGESSCGKKNETEPSIYTLDHLSDRTVLLLKSSSMEEIGIENGTGIDILEKDSKRFYVIDHKNFAQPEIMEMLKEYLPAEEVLHLRMCALEEGIYSFFCEFRKAFAKYPSTEAPLLVDCARLRDYLLYKGDKALIGLLTCGRTLRIISNRFDNFPNLETENGTLYSIFLSAMQIITHDVKKQEDEKRDQADRARSFETKKNIPKKILAIMEGSVLNRRFGYLEYDELCDTSKIDVVNAQILDFVDCYFPQVDLKGVSLRFRRLGNHHANGMYFPAYQCIAVELSHPSSFVHEFGHMLDYTQGGLSNRIRSLLFCKLYQAYVERLDEKLEQSGQMKTYQKGGTKSKYSYYTTETEVFARCFEMYVHLQLNLSNTIARSEEEWSEHPYAYHFDDAFQAMVCEYFGSLPCMEHLKERESAVA
jgi:hypothetical protein